MTLTSNIEQRNPQVLLSAINCCSYKIHGFHKIFAFRIFAKCYKKISYFFAKTLLGSEKKITNNTITDFLNISFIV